MNRSNWKLPFVDKNLFFFYEKEKYNKKNIINRSPVFIDFRSSVITELALDRKFLIPNGKEHTRVIIEGSQLGMKFGSLSITKDIGKNIHLYNKVQKKQKKN